MHPRWCRISAINSIILKWLHGLGSKSAWENGNFGFNAEKQCLATNLFPGNTCKSTDLLPPKKTHDSKTQLQCQIISKTRSPNSKDTGNVLPGTLPMNDALNSICYWEPFHPLNMPLALAHREKMNIHHPWRKEALEKQGEKHHIQLTWKSQLFGPRICRFQPPKKNVVEPSTEVLQNIDVFFLNTNNWHLKNSRKIPMSLPF